MGNGAQRIPSWPGAWTPTKAEYICADQTVTLIFRLRQSGGPYIPVRPRFPSYLLDDGKRGVRSVQTCELFEISICQPQGETASSQDMSADVKIHRTAFA